MNKFVNYKEVIQTQPSILINFLQGGGGGGGGGGGRGGGIEVHFGWLDVSFFDSATLALWPARCFFLERFRIVFNGNVTH